MYKKPNLFFYRLAQVASNIVAKLIFKRSFLRNELKGKKGPYIVIANHEAALDFVNLIGATSQRMSFVISNSFYNTLPIKKIFDKIGVIPKQQFQTSVRDLKMMKAVIDAGQPLVIYPAGLMCEDGLSTPIPSATYKFLKMMKTDIYVARTTGTYFVTPKWAKGIRPGRTYMDIYKLFSKEELKELVDFARLAPMGANIQPLKFAIISDDELLSKIYPCTKWAGYLPDGAPAEDERPAAYIAILGDLSLKKEFETDAGAAAENMILGAMEHSLASCWLGAIQRPEIMKLLELDEEKYKLLYLVAFGYPKQESCTEDISDNNVKYWQDDSGKIHVPKRTTEEVLIFEK